MGSTDGESVTMTTVLMFLSAEGGGEEYTTAEENLQTPASDN